MRDVYERLLPFGGLFNWSGACMSDASDLGLAMNAAALGTARRVRPSFRRCRCVLCEAPARSRIRRGVTSSGQWCSPTAATTARAREQAELTIELGTELGMTGPQGVVPRARALVDTL